MGTDYFPQKAKHSALGDEDVPVENYDDHPSGPSISSRLFSLEQQLDKLAEAVEMLHQEIKRIKGVIG